MKKLLLLAVLSLFISASYGQTYVFQEDFEGTTLGVTSSSSTGNNWAVTTTFAASGAKADSAVVALGDTTYLTTDAFSTSGSAIVYLEFDQIAKLEFFDAAIIEYSTDNGSTWTQVTSGYLGTGQFTNIGNKFNSTSYIDWLPATNNAVPTNTWWKHEKFDLSTQLANTAQAKIRFALLDVNNSGAAGNYGWLLDNIEVWKPSNQEASVAGYFLPYGLASGCGLGNEILQVHIANNGSANINGNLTVTFQREGQTAVTETVPNVILPYDTGTYTFSTTIDLATLQDTNYQVKVWVNLLNDPNQNNDTLVDSIVSRVPLADPIVNDTTIPYATDVLLSATHQDTIFWFSDPLTNNQLNVGMYYQTPILYDTTTYYVQATGALPDVKITEIVQFETGTGYTNPYPSWITGVTAGDFDGVEITNLGNGPADLSGWTMNFYSTDASWGVNGSYTFPSGVVLPSGGIAVVDIKTAASSTNAANFYFCAGLAGNPQSSATQGYYIKDASGSVVDAVATNSQAFAASTGVTANDWSGNIGASSGRAGVTRNVSDNNTASDWGIAGTNPTMQSFGTLNAGLTVGQGSGGSGGGGLMADCPSRAVPLTVNISGIPLNDAGLTSITPDGGVSQGTPLPIQVNLKNTGVDSLKKAKIYYSINDSIYPVYNWLGALPNDSSEMVTLTNYTFGSGVYRLKAWTSMPNDSVDFANHNDTISSFVYVCLSGSFTLGGPNADFQTFADLQVVLDSVGLCGPATVNILPGIYSDQLLLGNINGVSATNTLTFQSSTGNYNDVKMEYAASGTADNYVVKFNGASYITLKDLTINAKGSSYAYAVAMENGSQHNTIDGCYIKSDLITSSNGMGIRIYYSPVANHYNTIKNNIVEGGYYGIYHYGSSSSWQKGNQFINNEVKNWYYYGLYSYFSDSVQIVGNYIHDGQYTYNYHLYNYYPMGGYKVIGNTVISSSTSTYTYGLYDYYGNYYSYNPNPTDTGLVANNMVLMRGGTYAYGMYAYYSNGTRYYHNTIKVENATTTAYGVYQYNTTSNPKGQYFMNNIYSNESGASTSYCFYYGTPAKVLYSDYNNYYTTNTNVAYYSGAKATLAALQSSSGQDANSKEVDPGFLSSTDLHISSVQLNAAANFDTIVSYDIDGEMRDTLTPDIGADEFIVLGDDAGITAMVSPIVACPGDTMDIVVKLKNFGTDTLNSATVNWTMNNVVQTPLNFGGDLLAGADTNLTLGTYIFASGVSYDMEFWTSNPNGIADLQTGNDSTVITGYKTAIPAGTYTIGSGASADYSSIGAVITDLNTYGICGPVVFSIDTGTYTQNISLTNILGSSSTNTITFQSANGDSTSVVVNWTPAGTSEGGVTLNNQSYVHIKGITFNVTGSTTSGRAVYLQGNSQYNKIESCVFNQPIATSSNITGVYMNGADMKYNHFMNNIFDGGYYGAYVRGSSTTSLGKGNMFDNNTFSNFYYYGMYIYYQDSLMLRGNTFFNSATSAAYPRGLYSYYSDGPIQYTGNKFMLSPSSYAYGMYIYYNDATSGARGLIANNMISIDGGTSTNYGMYIYNSNFHDIVYNSINVPSGGTSTRGLYTSSGTGLKLRNNIIKSVAYAYYISTTTAITSSDYNDLYSTGANLAYWGGNRANLTALQTASSQETNSISLDPNFIAVDDLRLVTSPVDGLGQAITEVTVDYEGDLRDTLAPDMGADEFDPPAQDISLLSIENPTASGCGLTYETITVKAKEYRIGYYSR
jgi:parallel beta-helix repeat protein